MQCIKTSLQISTLLTRRAERARVSVRMNNLTVYNISYANSAVYYHYIIHTRFGQTTMHDYGYTQITLAER